MGSPQDVWVADAPHLCSIRTVLYVLCIIIYISYMCSIYYSLLKCEWWSVISVHHCFPLCVCVIFTSVPLRVSYFCSSFIITPKLCLFLVYLTKIAFSLVNTMNSLKKMFCLLSSECLDKNDFDQILHWRP